MRDFFFDFIRSISISESDLSEEIVARFDRTRIVVDRGLQGESTQNDDSKDFLRSIYDGSTNTWLRAVINTSSDVSAAFLMTDMQRNKGMNDTEWRVPGEGGAGIRYFPNVPDLVGHLKLQGFWLYSALFYIQLFGFYDRLLHYLCWKLDLGWEYNFSDEMQTQALLKKIKEKDPDMHKGIDEFNRQDALVYGRHHRNNIAHNFPPGMLDSRVTPEKTGNSIKISLGSARYTPTDVVFSNMDELMMLTKPIVNRIVSYRAS